MPKQSKMRQKDYKNPIQFILGWPTTPGPSAFPEVWLIYTLRLLEKTNYAFVSQEVVSYSHSIRATVVLV